MADELRMLIAGEWAASESGAAFDATNPAVHDAGSQSGVAVGGAIRWND